MGTRHSPGMRCSHSTSLVHNQVFFFSSINCNPLHSVQGSRFLAPKDLKEKEEEKEIFFKKQQSNPISLQASISRMLVCSFIFKRNWLLSCVKFFLILVFNCLFLVFICYILLVWLCCLFNYLAVGRFFMLVS